MIRISLAIEIHPGVARICVYVNARRISIASGGERASNRAALATARDTDP